MVARVGRAPVGCFARRPATESATKSMRVIRLADGAEARALLAHGSKSGAGTTRRNQTPVNIHLSKQIPIPRLKSENDICKVWLAIHRHDRPVEIRRLPVFSWRSKRDQPKISRFRVPFGILAQLVGRGDKDTTSTLRVKGSSCSCLCLLNLPGDWFRRVWHLYWGDALGIFRYLVFTVSASSMELSNNKLDYASKRLFHDLLLCTRSLASSESLAQSLRTTSVVPTMTMIVSATVIPIQSPTTP